MRKISQILVIDDEEWPYQKLLQDEGYHIERTATITNLKHLTDGTYALILLDIHGIGIPNDSKSDGITVLDYIKKTNPAQSVIVYSAKKQYVSSTPILNKADAVFDKNDAYVDYRVQIESLLLNGASLGYFIDRVNRELRHDVVKAPKLVPHTIRALRTGNTEKLQNYLARTIQDSNKVTVVNTIVSAGIRVLQEIGNSI